MYFSGNERVCSKNDYTNYEVSGHCVVYHMEYSQQELIFSIRKYI